MVSPGTQGSLARKWQSLDGRWLYHGRWERYYQRVARIAQALRGRLIAQLFAFDALAAQSDFVGKTWDRPWWRATFRAMCHRTFSRVFFGDPAFYAHVPQGFSIGDYIYDGMIRSLHRVLARENFMVSLILTGRLTEFDLPPSLSPAGFESIRSQLPKVTIATGDAVSLFESMPANSFTRFSLSDVPSFFDAKGFERLLAAIAHCAAPGARVCIRQFLTAHDIPARFGGVPVREPALEGALQGEDHAFAYRFVVGTIAK